MGLGFGSYVLHSFTLTTLMDSFNDIFHPTEINFALFKFPEVASPSVPKNLPGRRSDKTVMIMNVLTVCWKVPFAFQGCVHSKQ